MAVGVTARATSGVKRGEAMMGVSGTKERRPEAALDELPLANGKGERGEGRAGSGMLSGISAIVCGVRRSSSVGRRGSTFMVADMIAMGGFGRHRAWPLPEGFARRCLEGGVYEDEMKE